MAEQKEARRYITPQKAGIIIGISFLVIIIAISGIIISAITPKEPPASAKISAAAAPMAKPKIVWELDQAIKVSADWFDLPIKFDGKEHKIVPDIKSGEIEFLADGRFGVAKAFEQFDFGEIRNSLKVRSIKGDAVVYMYTARYL